MHRYFIQVFGKVQGVGFICFVNYTAKGFNLTGWVKNCNDDSVKVEVQGNKNTLPLFIKRLKRGNSFSELKSIYVKKSNLLRMKNPLALSTRSI